MDTRVKVSYRVMVEYALGTMSGPSTLTDDEGKPLPEFDLSKLGAHPFSVGYLDEEVARKVLPRAKAWADDRGRNEVWVDRVTETTTIERLDAAK